MVMQLGERMHCAGIVLHGVLEPAQWLEMLKAITAAIGMAPVAEPAIWTYPTEDGKGGTGQTFVLPISESFLALDTWSDHRGAYLFVCSCRAYQTKAIDDVAEQFGLKIELKDDRRFYRELNLTKESNMKTYPYQQANQAIGSGLASAASQVPQPQTIASALSRMDGLNDRLAATADRLSKICGMLGALHPTEAGESTPDIMLPAGAVARLNDAADTAHDRMSGIENLIFGLERALG